MKTTGSFQQTLSIWSIVEKQKRYELSVEYPELSTVVRIARRIWANTNFSDDARELAKNLINEILILKRTPLSPSRIASSLENSTSLLNDLVVDHPDHSQTLALTHLLDHTNQLLSRTSPIETMFESLVCSFDEAVLVTPNERTEDQLNEYLIKAELDGVIAMSIRTLRKRNELFELLVVINDLGDLDSFYPFLDVDANRQKNAWIIADSHAMNVAMIGERRILRLNREALVELYLDVEFENWIARDQAPKISTESLDDDDPVLLEEVETFTTLFAQRDTGCTEATIIRLESGNLLFFSPNDIHRPLKLQGIRNTESKLLKATSFEEGDRVLIFGDSGSINDLREDAQKALESDNRLFDFENAHRIATTLKERVKSEISQRGRGALEEELRLRGKSHQQARTLISTILMPNYIAPNYENFSTIAKILGLQSEIENYQSIEKYRNAIRIAGKNRSDKVEKFLRENPSWRESLEASGYVKVADESFGIIHVEVVESVSLGRHEVPYSLVNRLCNEISLKRL